MAEAAVYVIYILYLIALAEWVVSDAAEDRR